jgi:hypothetical protein
MDERLASTTHTAKGGGERFHINLSSGPESGVLMGGYD